MSRDVDASEPLRREFAAHARHLAGEHSREGIVVGMRAAVRELAQDGWQPDPTTPDEPELRADGGHPARAMIVDVWKPDAERPVREFTPAGKRTLGLVPDDGTVEDDLAGDLVRWGDGVFRAISALHDGDGWRVMLVPRGTSEMVADHLEGEWLREVIGEDAGRVAAPGGGA